MIAIWQFIFDILLFLVLFSILKAAQMIASFGYTTYKSLTFHRSMAHAFTPGLRDRLKEHIWRDATFFLSGVLVASFAGAIRQYIGL
jgi:hypothetical protein